MLESQTKRRLNPATPPRPLDIDRIPEPVHPTKKTRLANYLALGSLLMATFALFIFFNCRTLLYSHNGYLLSDQQRLTSP